MTPSSSPATRTFRYGFATVALVLLVFAAGCVPPGGGPTSLHITTSPSLYPSFRTDITDYVSRCNASAPVDVTVGAPAGTTVSVDGATPASGSFTAQVTRDVGQRFAIVVTSGAQTTTHYVRCLPGDFPSWTALRTGTTQAEFYVTTARAGSFPVTYPVVWDANGVPVWWGPRTARTFVFPLNGHIAWNNGNGAVEEHEFDGSLVRTYTTLNDPLDVHDLVLLPNGNYLVVTATPKSGVDLSSWGGPSNVTITDHIIQEISPTNQLVWSWRTSDHISVDETGAVWRAQELADPGGASGTDYDPFHWNSIEWTGDGVILSYRHLDAIYKVDVPSGAIEWKIGGSTRPESLAVLLDPVFQSGSGFGGQHDAREPSPGTITLYDDGSGRNRAPRAVTYHLDLTARTATFVRSVSDPLEPTAVCCGSTRLLPGGNYVIGWGGNATTAPDFTESTRFGARLFELTYTDANASVYRALPVLPGEFSRDDLRAGMDAQYPG
jgi:hypothetical protein